MTIDPKHKLLIVLTLILAIVVTYRIVNPWRQQTVAALTYGRATKVITPQENRANESALQQLTQIKTDLLAPPPKTELMVYRDPFRRPQKAPAPPAPQPDAQKPLPTPLSPAERAREALQRFKVLGSFRQGDIETLFLQRGQQVIIINVGDRIDGRFTIEAIDGRSVVVSAPEISAPFQIEFEELQPSATSGRGRPAIAPPKPTQTHSTAVESPPIESTGSMSSTLDEDSPTPPLPEPPPIDNPVPEPSSKGSPSRDYLPGNKPLENDPSSR